MDMFTPERKKAIRDRLQRIKGQLEGIGKMVEADKPCIEVLTQISSAYEALRGVSKIVMRNYLETCATNAIRSDVNGEAEDTYDDLMEVIYKFAK